MSDKYVTLLGAEDVQCAGHRIAQAADAMQRAASQLEDTFHRQRIFLDDWLMRFEAAMKSPESCNHRDTISINKWLGKRNFLLRCNNCGAMRDDHGVWERL